MKFIHIKEDYQFDTDEYKRLQSERGPSTFIDRRIFNCQLSCEAMAIYCTLQSISQDRQSNKILTVKDLRSFSKDNGEDLEKYLNELMSKLPEEMKIFSFE